MANKFDCALCVHADVCPGYMVTQIECAHFLSAGNVTPVVQCKDCQWYHVKACCPLMRSGLTENGAQLPLPNDFCAYGERW